MIDFSKPMRMKDTREPLLEDPDFIIGCLRRLNGVTHFINEAGHVFRLDYWGRVAENTPPEPRRRYQAQFKDGSAGNWYDEKYRLCDTLAAWLIETDHGPEATQRYTYEREEVRK